MTASGACLPEAERLAPYARFSLGRAERFATHLHARELCPEHWLVSLLQDEDCAATRLVLHAFADPRSIGGEVLALCPGIMVVGSGHSLPFSVLGVAALRSARAGAAARGAERVEPGDVLRAALARVSPEAHARLELAAGGGAEFAAAARTPTEEGSPRTTDLEPLEQGSFFGCFSGAALRALGVACRAAGELGRDAIGPVHLLAGSLEVDPALREHTRLSPGRLRVALSGLDADPTPLPARTLRADESLLELLSSVPPGADTLDVLGWMLAHGTDELRALLRRQKITTALHERARGVFRDPEPPASPAP